MKNVKLVHFGLALLISFGVAFYFRISDLRVRHFMSDEALEKRIEYRVDAFMRYQLEPQLRKKVGDVSEKEFQEMYDKNLEGLKRRDHDEFTDKIQKTRSIFPRNDGLSRIYITGADSYHYFDLSKRIDRNGNIAEKFRLGGMYFDTMRRYPVGLWSPWTLHPYLGYAWHRVVHFFTGWDIMTSICTFPLFILFLSYVAYFFLMRTLQIPPWIAFFGGLVLAFAPIHIERAAYGWYDTDGYFFVLPVFVLALFFRGTKQETRKKVYIHAMIAGLLTILYSYLWQGWPIVLTLVLGSGILIWALSFFRDDLDMPEVMPFMIAYALTVFVLALIAMTPKGVYNATVGAYLSTLQYSAREVSGWPDMFIIVRETQPLNWDELVQHSGSMVNHILAAFGAIGVFWNFVKNKDRRALGPTITLFLFYLGTLYLSLKTARFVLIFTLPLSFFAMFGVYSLYVMLRKKFRFPKIVFLLVGLLCFLPHNVYATFHQMLKTDLRFYNDAWDKVLHDLREKTPQDSVVMSWWPSGYFVTAMGERPVYADGGSQHTPMAYWTARFYISQDPREALGIIRMLNAGGNGAAEYLIKEKGKSIPQAVRLLNKLIRISRAEAEKKLGKGWDANSRKEFLDLSHGTKNVPTYVMAYHDIVLKASSISLIGRWEFPGKKQFKYDEFTIKDQKYPSSVLRSQVPSDIAGKQGSRIFFYNGTAIDLTNFEPSYRSKTKKNLEGRPMYFYYAKDGKFHRIIDKEPGNIKVSFMVAQRGNTFRSILADPQLIESVLFRMYYADGAGMPAFKQVSASLDPVTRYRNYMYEVNWDWLDAQEQA